MPGITDPTEAYFKDGQWGWDGTQWRKLPLVWGYSDTYREYIYEDNVDAGTNLLDGSAVPAGEIWVVTFVRAHCVQAGLTRINIYQYYDTTSLYLYSVESPAAYVYAGGPCSIVMEEGDKIRAAFLNCALNDDIRLYITGYKMAIAE